MATAPPQQFCVRWNSYHSNLQTWFPRLLSSEQFADVTLACESRQLRCHKVVLSACSAYLERLLSTNPCKHPIVLMRDMRFSEMQALVDFMYKGEVNVTQEELPSLLKSAEALQIRGLCSSENGGLSQERQDTKDFAVASDALLANAQRDNTHVNGPSHQKLASPPAKKTLSKEEVNVKEETVEEDGLYYGELDADNMEYNEDEEPGKPGGSLAQTSDFAISNVQCQYDSGSEMDAMEPREELTEDHTYGAPPYEPPAFLIRQSNQPLQSLASFSELRPKIMTIGPGFPGVNLIHVADQPPLNSMLVGAPPEYSINKRIRRSEVVLRQAADCVSRGLTFQTVSEQFNIPISTIRFFMARKGILPRRRRGRNIQAMPPAVSPEPPFLAQHCKPPAPAPAPTRFDNEESIDHA